MFSNRLFLFSILCILILNLQISSQNEEAHEHGHSNHHIDCEDDEDCTSKWGEKSHCDVTSHHCACADGSELKSGKCVNNMLDIHEEQKTKTAVQPHVHDETPVQPHVHDETPVQPHVHDETPVQPRVHGGTVPGNTTQEEGEEDINTRALVDQVCNVDKDCSIQDAICISKKCACPSNFILSANMNKCLPLATEVGWGCEENAQCTTLLNKTTECRDFMCACKSGTTFKEGKCVESKGLDAFCETSMVCTTPYAECSQGICACVEDYVPSPDNSKCLELAQGFRAPCEETIQCSHPFGPDSTCLNNQCVCRGGHHFAEMRCWKDKGLTEVCVKNAECHIVEDGASQKLECVGGQCVCQEGFEPDLENLMCSGESITIASISTLLALALHLL